jgi:hypothetical protein
VEDYMKWSRICVIKEFPACELLDKAIAANSYMKIVF